MIATARMVTTKVTNSRGLNTAASIDTSGGEAPAPPIIRAKIGPMATRHTIHAGGTWAGYPAARQNQDQGNE